MSQAEECIVYLPPRDPLLQKDLTTKAMQKLALQIESNHSLCQSLQALLVKNLVKKYKKNQERVTEELAYRSANPRWCILQPADKCKIAIFVYMSGIQLTCGTIWNSTYTRILAICPMEIQLDYDRDQDKDLQNDYTWRYQSYVTQVRDKTIKSSIFFDYWDNGGFADSYSTEDPHLYQLIHTFFTEYCQRILDSTLSVAVDSKTQCEIHDQDEWVIGNEQQLDDSC